MITVKQILEQYDIVTDKASSHDLYLADLASSGIIEESKIPMLRRSLNKNINEMTVAEKKSLVSLIESLMTEKSDGGKSYPSDKDMPAVIILKRKAIRVFPDNQKIGLYYSQALDRYISIPFGSNVKDLNPQLNEEHQMVTGPTMVSQIMTADTKRAKATKRGLKVVAAQTSPSTTFGANLGLWLAKRFIRFKDDKPYAVTSVPSTGTKVSSQPWGAAPEEVPTQKQTQNPVESPSIPFSQRSGPQQARAMRNPPKSTKESFRNNLRILREEKEVNENVTDYIPGSGYVAAARELRNGNIGKALSHATLETATTGAGAVMGSVVPGAGTAAGAAAGAVAKGLIKGGARQIGRAIFRRTVRSKARARDRKKRDIDSPDSSTPKDYSSNSEPFGPVKNTQPREFAFSGPGQATFKTGDPQSQQSVVGAGGVRSAQQQVTLYSRYPGMPISAVNNESTIFTLKQIVENNVPSHQLQIGEETISINKSIAKKLLKLHESLNRTNKKKLERMLNEDIVSFRKVVNFALK